MTVGRRKSDRADQSLRYALAVHTTSGSSPPERRAAGSLHYERHRPEKTTLYRLVQQHAASFIAHTQASIGGELPRFIKDEFDAFLECAIPAHGFLRLRCGQCGHDKLPAFSCKRRGFCPSCGARRMSQSAAHQIEHVIARVPLRQLVLSLPIQPRLLLAAQPGWVTQGLQVVQRVVTGHLLDGTQLRADEGHGGAVTLIQRFGSAARWSSCSGWPHGRPKGAFHAPVPRPRLHLIRFHGVLAPNAKLRSQVVPLGPQREEQLTAAAFADGRAEHAAQVRPGRIS